jgi:PAS domain S-box-containing protein
MTLPVADTRTKITRCAVCKIDRKGKFILADHESEKLFGLSEVKLFGQPFVDFLIPEDREAVCLMTGDRNPYETVYDAARLTIVNAQGEEIPALVILSVNFGGGNPANYQIIVLREEGEASESATKGRTAAWWRLADGLCRDTGDIDLDQLTSSLRDASGAAAVELYSHSAIPDNFLAGAGERSQSSTADNQSASNENRATFVLPDGQPGVAVFVSGADTEAADVDLAATLLHRLCPPGSSGGAEIDADVSSLSVGDILARMGMVFMYVDEAHNIRDVSENCELLFSGLQCLTSLEQWIENLAALGNKAVVTEIDTYFKVSRSESPAPEFRSSFVSSFGENVELRIVRLQGYESGPEWLVLMGPLGNPLAQAGGRASVSSDLVRALCKSTQEVLAAGSELGTRLEHAYHGLIEDQADFQLSCLNRHLDDGQSLLAGLESVAAVSEQRTELRTVNLSLLIGKTVDAIRESHAGKELEVTTAKLPSLKADGRRVPLVVEGLLNWWCDRPSLMHKAVISLESSEHQATLHFDFEAAGVTEKQVSALFALPVATLESDAGIRSVSGSNLVFTKEIASQTGGRLEARSLPGQGVRISFSFPIA